MGSAVAPGLPPRNWAISSTAAGAGTGSATPSPSPRGPSTGPPWRPSPGASRSTPGSRPWTPPPGSQAVPPTRRGLPSRWPSRSRWRGPWGGSDALLAPPSSISGGHRTAGSPCPPAPCRLGPPPFSLASGRRPRPCPRRRPPRPGRVRTLSSPRYRLSGRPDELRRSRDGRLVPVEIKSTRAPHNGVPYPSHRIQLLAYCLLLEETLGVAPPFGLLSFGDKTEISVPWDDGAWAQVLEVLREWPRPYSGAMDPAPGKCHTCQFNRVCEGAGAVGVS